jgi:hypothetical protein
VVDGDLVGVGGHVTAEAGNQPSSAQTASSADNTHLSDRLYDIINISP